jgi:hypothetical protein
MLSRSIVPVVAFSTVVGLVPLATAHASSGAPGAACGAPFDNPSNITSVEPYKVVETNLKRSSNRLEGAVITVAAEPGVTREWLQRLVTDPATTAQPGCPMAVPGAMARVSSTGDGFAITMSSAQHNGGKEILERAHALNFPGNVPIEGQ